MIEKQSTSNGFSFANEKTMSQNNLLFRTDLPEFVMQWKTWKSRIPGSLSNFSMFFDSLRTMECWCAVSFDTSPAVSQETLQERNC